MVAAEAVPPGVRKHHRRRLVRGERSRPKDALVETRGLPLSQFRSFRMAALGVLRGAAGMFAKTCYVRELPSRVNTEQLLVSVSWV